MRSITRFDTNEQLGGGLVQKFSEELERSRDIPFPTKKKGSELSEQAKHRALRNLLIKIENAVREIKENKRGPILLGEVVQSWAKQILRQLPPELRNQQTADTYIRFIKEDLGVDLDMPLSVDKVFVPKKDKHFIFDSVIDELDEKINKLHDKIEQGIDIVNNTNAINALVRRQEAMKEWKDKLLSNALFNKGFNKNKGTGSHLFNRKEADDFFNELSDIVYFSEGVNLYPEVSEVSKIREVVPEVQPAPEEELEEERHALNLDPEFESESSPSIGSFHQEIPAIPEKAELPEDKKRQLLCRNFLKYMLTGVPEPNLFDMDLFKTLVLKKDEKIVAGLRKAVQDVFLNLDLDSIKPWQDEQFAMQISDILAMYTFFDPYKEKGPLRIPQKLGDKWELVDFNIIPIKLKYDEASAKRLQKAGIGSSEEDIDENYPAYSYLLKPQKNLLKPKQDLSNVVPKLVFMGTPPDAAQGHFYAAHTDFAPKDPQTGRPYSVGETMYRANRQHIADALRHNGVSKVNVTGQSLGGALSLFFALDKPELCNRVDAFNAPGFRKETYKSGGYEKGYDLVLMSNDLKKHTIEFKCEKNGLKYRVIGLDNIEKTDTLYWKELKKKWPNFPDNDDQILANKNTLLPIILSLTSKKGHTHEKDGKWAWSKLTKEQKKNKVFIHFQKGDPVNKLGYWKKTWNLIKIYAKPSKPYSELYGIAPQKVKTLFDHPVKGVEKLDPNIPFIVKAILAILTKRTLTQLANYMLRKWLPHLQTFSNMDSIAMRINTERENEKGYRSVFTAIKRIANPFVYSKIKEKIEASKQKIAEEPHLFVSNILSAQTIDDLGTILKDHKKRSGWADAIKNEFQELSVAEKLRFLSRIDIAIHYYKQLSEFSKLNIRMDNAPDIKREAEELSDSFAYLKWSVMGPRDEETRKIIDRIDAKNALFKKTLPSYFSYKHETMMRQENLPEHLSADVMMKEFGSWKLSSISRKNFERYLPDELLSIKNEKLNAIIERFRPKDNTKKTKRINRYVEGLQTEIAQILSDKDTRDQEAKIVAFDDAVLSFYTNVRREGEPVLAEQLRAFMMSAQGLHFTYKYGLAATVTQDLQNNPPLFDKTQGIQSIRYNQIGDNFLNNAQQFFLTRNPPYRSLTDYMIKNELFFSTEDSLKKTNLCPPELKDTDVKDEEEFDRNYVFNRENVKSDYEYDENKKEWKYNPQLPQPNEKDRARILIIMSALAQENKKLAYELFPLLSPKDINNAQFAFPFTCKHQKLRYLLNKNHLKTSKSKRDTLIDPLMNRLSIIQNKIDTDGANEKDYMEILKSEIAQVYRESVNNPDAWKTRLFGESNLAETLAKFMREEFGLNKEDLLNIKELKHNIIVEEIEPSSGSAPKIGTRGIEE